MPPRLRPHPHKGGSLGSRPARTWTLWGFLTFIPSILRDYGLDAGSASRMLFFSALIATPATVTTKNALPFRSVRSSGFRGEPDPRVRRREYSETVFGLRLLDELDVSDRSRHRDGGRGSR